VVNVTPGELTTFLQGVFSPLVMMWDIKLFELIGVGTITFGGLIMYTILLRALMFIFKLWFDFQWTTTWRELAFGARSDRGLTGEQRKIKKQYRLNDRERNFARMAEELKVSNRAKERGREMDAIIRNRIARRIDK